MFLCIYCTCTLNSFKLVGGFFDLETNFVIKNPENVVHVLKFIDTTPEKTQVQLTAVSMCMYLSDRSSQAEVWSMLSGILRKSKRNMLAFCEADASRFVLNKMNSTSPMIAGKICRL